MAGGGVGLIEAALEQVASLDVDDLLDQQLAAAVLQTEQLLNAVHALSAALLERFEQCGGWAADGALSAAAWTAQRTGSARAGLRDRRRQGAALAQLPAVASEARAGKLSTEHVRALGVCVRRHPDLAVEHEAIWLEQAAVLDAEGFRLATRHWLAAAADTDSADPAEADTSDQVSSLHVSRTFEGWLRVDGTFSPDDADLVEAALGAGVDQALRAAHDGDPSVAGRAVSALRAGVLVDLLSQTMRQEPSDVSAPDRYRVAVVVRHGQPTVPAEAACDAGAYRVVLGAQERGPRRRPPDQPVAGRHPPGDHRPGPGLRVPRLRPAAVMDRHPSLCSLDGKRQHVGG